mmetsp:Transcript_55446/g.129333  ORF Transcript_55446/g.129333 Transcript_55446/m.129333 type:complete len:207 (+) Transcript_55446:1040-1660(+)
MLRSRGEPHCQVCFLRCFSDSAPLGDHGFSLGLHVSSLLPVAAGLWLLLLQLEQHLADVVLASLARSATCRPRLRHRRSWRARDKPIAWGSTARVLHLLPGVCRVLRFATALPADHAAAHSFHGLRGRLFLPRHLERSGPQKAAQVHTVCPRILLLPSAAHAAGLHCASSQPSDLLVPCVLGQGLLQCEDTYVVAPQLRCGRPQVP